MLIFDFRYLRAIRRFLDGDIITYCHDVDRYLVVNGKRFSPIIDEIMVNFKSIDMKIISLASPGSKFVWERGFSNPIPTNLLFRLSGSLRYFNFLLPSILKSNNASLLSVLFRFSKARILIGIGIPPILSRAARSAGLTVIEIAHGYGACNPEFKLPFEDKKSAPQFYLIFEEAHEKVKKRLADLEIEEVIVPNPSVHRFKNGFRQSAKGKQAKAPRKTEVEFSKEILVSLQWGYDNDSPLYYQLGGIIKNGILHEEIIKVIDRTPNIFWKLRLHPVQLMDNKYEHHKLWLEDFVQRRSNCEWESASNSHFLDIVNSCDGHLTMQSSSCYEAAAVGIRSLCLCPALQKGGRNFGRFARLENEGFVIVGEAKSKILEAWVSNVKPINARINQTQHLNFPEMIEFLKEKLINF